MPFEPFSVQCLTCGSRLKVPDPSLIGTIAACPKCNSMVQIELNGSDSSATETSARPQVAVGASSVDSEAITEGAIAAPEMDDSANPSGFSGGDEVEPQPAETGPLPPSWQSTRTRRSRQIALVVAVSISGLLASVLMFSWFVRNWNSESVSQVDEPSTEVTPEPETEEPVPGEAASGDPDNTEAEPNPESGQPSVEANDTPEDNVAPADVAPDSIPPAPVPPEAEEPVVPPSLLPGSPIFGGPAEDAEAPEPDAPPTLEKLPEGLAQFGVSLDTQGPADWKPNEDAPPTLDEVDINAPTMENIDPLLLATPIKTINVRSDLAMKVALDSKGYPLADLALLLSQLTDVPIQLDWVSFDLCGIDAHEPFPVPGGFPTVKELLDKIAAKLGAEIQIEASLINLTPSDESFAARSAAVASMEDFGEEKASAVGVLHRFLHANEDDPGPELQVGPSREDQQFAIIAVESLRRMRGVSGKVPDGLLAHWAQVSENHTIQWPPLSGGQIGPQRTDPISICGLIRDVSRQNDSSTIVFWSDAVRRRLNPTRVLLPRHDVDAASTLRRVLDDYGLQVRKVDENRWWIGTASTYDRAKVVVWTKPLADGGEALKNQIARVMAQRDTFRIEHDPVSKRALMLLPRYIVRQLPKIEASLVSN